MKIIIPTQELNFLISKLLNVVGLKPAIPILSNILFEAKNGEIILTATDLMVGIRCSTEAKILKEGSTTLPAKRLAQLLRELSVANLEITTNEHEITEIIAGSSKFKLHGMSGEEYPTLPDMKSEKKFKISQIELKEVLNRTSFAVSREDNRYVLTGVFLNINGSSVTFIGTDGKRLAKTYKLISQDSPFTGSYIIPAKAVEEIIKNLTNDEEEILCFLTEDKIAFQTKSSIIVSKLLEGDYPDVDKVIPEIPDTIVTIHREELTSLLRQISLFTNENQSVRFTFSSGELILTANTIEVGEGLVKMPVNYYGDKLEIAFNPHYFLDILRHGKTETIKLGLIDCFNPGVITDEDQEPVRASNPSPLYVLMPLRLREE